MKNPSATGSSSRVFFGDLGAGISGPRSSRARTRAFTLIEILLVLALIGFLASVLVVGSVRLLSGQAPTPEEVFWKAVAGARRMALVSGKDVQLQFKAGKDKDEERALVASGLTGSQRFPFVAAGNLTVDFLSTQKGKSAILVGGDLIQTQTMPLVTFYSDGTCSPFIVQFHSDGPGRTLSIDPWTCAQVLKPTDSLSR
jgi:prepilin-type N-terminal cleavage/methylation domain-containing protein